MDPLEIPLDSDALRANMPPIPQTVVIPERYEPLLTAVAGYQGVKKPLTETLTEYFHNYRNVDLLVDGFQTILLRNWSYLERADSRAQSFTLLSELVLDLLDTPLTSQQASLLLRQLLTWSTAALSGTTRRRVRRAPAHGRRVSGPLRAEAAARLPGARHPAARPGEADGQAACARAGVHRALPHAPAARLSPGVATSADPRVGRLGGRRTDRP